MNLDNMLNNLCDIDILFFLIKNLKLYLIMCCCKIYICLKYNSHELNIIDRHMYFLPNIFLLNLM